MGVEARAGGDRLPALNSARTPKCKHCLGKNEVFCRFQPFKFGLDFVGFRVPISFDFLSQIYQNPLKIRSQEVFKFPSIFASIFYGFWSHFGGPVGAMLATRVHPGRPRTPRGRPRDAPRRSQDGRRRPLDAPGRR